MRNYLSSIFFIVIWAAVCFFASVSAYAATDTALLPPDFAIQAHSDKGFEYFNRKINVFGIPVYAAPSVDEDKLRHAATILAEYLDNDEDGNVDNQRILAQLHRNKAFLVMWYSQLELEQLTPPDSWHGQDLGNDETRPEWHRNGHKGRFDASLEEVWHLITSAGFSPTYPDVFGEEASSQIAQLMDTARGGHFTEVPHQYPPHAYFTYDDETCDYQCMVTEFFYWGMTSLLGAQAGRANEISEEWRLYTPKRIKQQTPELYGLLTNPYFRLPAKLPDGVYQPTKRK